MSSNYELGGVYLVEKEIKPRKVTKDKDYIPPPFVYKVLRREMGLEDKKEENPQLVPAFDLEEETSRDIENLDCSIFTDSYKKPIIKLVFCRTNEDLAKNDRRYKRISDLEIITNGSISFKRYLGYYTQSNLELTEKGYKNVDNFLRNNMVGVTVASRAGIKFNSKKYNAILKKTKGKYLLTIQTPINPDKYDVKILPENNRLRLTSTNDQFNRYIFERLRETYDYFSDSF